MSRRDKSAHQGSKKKESEGMSRGDWLFGISLFIVVVLVAFASVWYGLLPVGQQAAQQQTTFHLYTLPQSDPT